MVFDRRRFSRPYIDRDSLDSDKAQLSLIAGSMPSPSHTDGRLRTGGKCMRDRNFFPLHLGSKWYRHLGAEMVSTWLRRQLIRSRS